MGARQQTAVTKFVQIFSDGLRSHIKASRQVIHLDSSRLPRNGENLVLARTQLGHGKFQKSFFKSLFSFFFALRNNATQYISLRRTMLSLTILLTFVFFRLILLQGSNQGAK